MLRTAFVLGCLALAGCVSSAPPARETSAPLAPSEPDYFEPALPAPAVPPVPVERPAHALLHLGTAFYYAQSFVAADDGYLTALQLPLNRQPGGTGNLTIEILHVETPASLPDDQAPVAARILIPADAVESRGYIINSPLSYFTLDLTPFRLRIRKGETLMFRSRPEGERSFGFFAVSGNPYPAGTKFDHHNWGDNRVWRPDQEDDLVFRAFAAPTLPEGPATQSATIKPQFSTPPGTLFASAEWVPSPSKPAPKPSQAAMPPPFLSRAKAFQFQGRYYVQLSLFNPSRISRPCPARPTSIVVMPRADATGYVVDVHTPDATSAYVGTPQLGPNEGLIRTYLLGDAINTLPPGDYRVVMVFPPEVSAWTIDAPITLAAPPSTRPATPSPRKP